MLQAHPEYPNYQLEEVIIVGLSDAVIQVPAVVVEPRGTPVALAAVLGPTKHMGVAYLAVIFVSIRVKRHI